MKHNNNILSKKKIIIPLGVKEKFDKLFEIKSYQKTTKYNFAKCISIILYHELNEGDDYVPLAANYWKKIYGGNYYKAVLEPLIKANIIQVATVCNNTKEGFQKKQNLYRINPEYFDDKVEVVEYTNSNDTCDIYSPFLEFDNFIIKDKNLKISIDYDKTIKWIDDNAENIFNSYYHPEFITSDMKKVPSKIKYFNNGISETKHLTIESFESKIPKGDSFFYYKNSIYQANYQEFHDYKVNIIKKHYKFKVNELVNTEIDTSRNRINHRLHNQLVTFPSKLLPYVTINNASTVQIDLRTSQFLIFANLINSFLNNKHQELIQFFKYKNTKDYLTKLFMILESYKNLLPVTSINIDEKQDVIYHNDVHQFISDIFYQDFYGLVQNELGLKDRGLTKLILFLLIFKKKTTSNLLTDKLIKKYKTVISIMNEFKATDSNNKSEKTDPKDENGNDDNQDNNFAVMLQCVEAEIFIDNILIPLQKKGIPCFSRHDSIVVDHRYRDEVINQIKDVFKNIGFYYVSKEDDFFWNVADIEEAEKNGFLDYYSEEQEFEEMCRLADDLEYQSSLELRNDSIIKSNERIDVNNDLTDVDLKNFDDDNDSFKNERYDINKIFDFDDIKQEILRNLEKKGLVNSEDVINKDDENETRNSEKFDFINLLNIEDIKDDMHLINSLKTYNLTYNDIDYLLNDLVITTDICEDYYNEVTTEMLEVISNQNYISPNEKDILQNEILEQFGLKSPIQYSLSTNKIIRQLIYSIYHFINRNKH